MASKLLLGQPALIVVLGVVVGFVVPDIVAKMSKEGPDPYTPPHRQVEFSPTALLSLSAIVGLCGALLLWLVYRNYDSIPEGGLLAASMIYVPGVVLGVALKMALWARKEKST